MPKVIKKKVSKKHDTPEQQSIDNIMHSLDGVSHERRDKAMKIGIAVLVLLVLIFGGRFYMNSQAESAAKLHYEGYKTLHGLYAFANTPVAERARVALESFNKALDKKKKPETMYYIALCQDILGNTKDAEDMLKKLLAEYPNEPRFLPLGYYKLGMIYAREGRAEEALGAFGKVEQLSSGAMKDFALAESARLLMAAGREPEALVKYETIRRTMPESTFVSEAEIMTGKDKEEEKAAEPEKK